jgi:GNAT superfamily N-acetyltransferase
MTIQNLTRAEYNDSISLILDPKTQRFADQAKSWWDRHFSWNAQGCDVLIDEDGRHVSYLFSKVDRYHEYLIIYNLFTPQCDQRHGYAHALLEQIIARSLENKVKRITFSSVSDSLDFYLSLGFVFWGINAIGDYHCDLPIPKEGLNGFNLMTKTLDLKLLAGSRFEKIYAKVHGNREKLSTKQALRHQQDCVKLTEQWSMETLVQTTGYVPIGAL